MRGKIGREGFFGQYYLMELLVSFVNSGHIIIINRIVLEVGQNRRQGSTGGTTVQKTLQRVG
jgi:hypothetical protein